MTLLLAFLVMLATVPLLGGDLRRLEDVRLRYVWLAVVAVAVQVVLIVVAPEGDSTLHRVGHLLTYVLVGFVVVANLQLRFMWVVGLGGLLNFIAIAANGGVMPASEGVMRTAGLDVSEEFTNSDYVENANLGFLGDVFAIPDGWPGANVFSIGDVVIVIGAFLVLHAVTGSRLLGRRRSQLVAHE
jgi:Family of unknown function (DUF5317)